MTIEQICRRLRKLVTESEEAIKTDLLSEVVPAQQKFFQEGLPLVSQLLSRLYEIGLEDTSRPITEPPGPPDEDPEEEKT